MKKAAIVTYGCAMNVNDSMKMKSVLREQGYEITENTKEADIILINTCTVREGAADKVYGKLEGLRQLKRNKKDLIIGVAGCLAQEKKDDIIKENPHVDIVLGNQNVHMLGEYIKKIEEKTERHVVLVKDEDVLPPRIDTEFDSTMTASVSITYGCNNFCTYCIVPYVRGRERSAPIEDVLGEIKSYIEKGYKEIILLGQNVNSYGNGMGENFAKLLTQICKIEGEFLVRFMSPHPRDFTDDVIDVIAKEEKISKNVHMPLQAGSTYILEKMNRGYTKEDYLALVEKMKTRVPGLALTTDIIVGFPGERDIDFEDTMDVVEKARYENAYMFMYSKREGTPAATMEEQVDEEVKKDRLHRLMDMQTQISRDESEKYVGKTVKILVEKKTDRSEKLFSGRTDSNKIVLFSGNEEMIGKFINVKIYEAKTWTIYGEVV